MVAASTQSPTGLREFRGLAARHGSRVVLARPPRDLPHGIGDVLRVLQIGRVLVDNAVRYARSPVTDWLRLPERLTIATPADRAGL